MSWRVLPCSCMPLSRRPLPRGPPLAVGSVSLLPSFGQHLREAPMPRRLLEARARGLQAVVLLAELRLELLCGGFLGRLQSVGGPPPSEVVSGESENLWLVGSIRISSMAICLFCWWRRICCGISDLRMRCALCCAPESTQCATPQCYACGNVALASSAHEALSPVV